MWFMKKFLQYFACFDDPFVLLHTRIKSYYVSITGWTFSDLIENESVNISKKSKISGKCNQQKIEMDKWRLRMIKDINKSLNIDYLKEVKEQKNLEAENIKNDEQLNQLYEERNLKKEKHKKVLKRKFSQAFS